MDEVQKHFRNPEDLDTSKDKTVGFRRQMTIQLPDKVEVKLDVRCSYPMVCPLHPPIPSRLELSFKKEQMDTDNVKAIFRSFWHIYSLRALAAVESNSWWRS